VTLFDKRAHHPKRGLAQQRILFSCSKPGFFR